MLSLASYLYSLAARRRRAAIERDPARIRHLQRPVISVGNLSVGGSGKTPLVAWLAAQLLEAGERPAILSRGYARTAPDDGVTIVSDGVRLRADLSRSGDEPLLLARAVPHARVLVCAERYLSGRLAELHLGATVHVLDDGFQHVVLARDVNLLLIEPSDFDSPRTLPAGRLRESPAAARYADALLVAGDANACAAISDTLGVPTAFRVARASTAPVEETPRGLQVPVPPHSRVVLVSGIARPDRFEQETRNAGFEIAATMTFRDHHAFGPGDVLRIRETMRSTAAAFVLTTEKDLMRLLPLRPWPFRVAVSPLSVHVADAAFLPWLTARLETARGTQAVERLA